MESKYNINNMSRKQLEKEIVKSKNYTAFYFIVFVVQSISIAMLLYQLYFM